VKFELFGMFGLKTLKHVLLVVATCVAAMVGLRFLTGRPCSEVPQCASFEHGMSRQYHGYLAMGLSALLTREISALLATYFEASGMLLPLSRVRDACFGPFLLCLVLLVLTVSQAVLASAESINLLHTTLEEGRPVSTIRYAEWLISTPLLLALSGHCALKRPLQEITKPIVVTEVYIVISWAALLVSAAALRCALAVAAFMGYGWATGGMLGWVLEFLRDSPSNAVCCKLRISSVATLIVLFAVYRINYLFAIFRIIDPQMEQITYAVLGFCCKVSMSMIFTAIRVMENRHEMSILTGRVHGMGAAFMSLLRGNFDLVIPCSADPNGICQLPVISEGDTHELEQCLGRPISGSSFNELLAGVLQKQRFGAYVKNALHHSASLQSCESVSLEDICGHSGSKHDSMPQIADVLHVRLERMPATSLAQIESVTDDAFDPFVEAVVYLSPVPDSHMQEHLRQQVVMGLRLIPKDSMGMMSSLARAALRPSERSSAKRAPTSDGAASTTADSNDTHSDRHNPTRQLRTGEAKKGIRAGNWRERWRRKRVKMLGKKQKALASSRREEQAVSPCDHSEADALIEPFAGAWDASSQSSKLSCVGSVTMACRQLLGPLHDQLPPRELLSKRVEDHVQCAAEMVRLKACAKISGLHYEQQLNEWNRCKAGHIVGNLLSRSKPPGKGIDEQVWRSELLPHLQEPSPGRQPRAPDLPDDVELWYRAWRHTYEDNSMSSESSDSGDSEDVGSPVLLGQVPSSRLTARTDPRMRLQ